MKLTKRQIRNIIREELQQVLLEKEDGSGPLGKYVMPTLILFNTKNNLRSSLSVSQKNPIFFVLHK